MITKTYDETKWKLVPVEPTEGMTDVLTTMLTECHSVEESYADLLAAAPEALSQNTADAKDAALVRALEESQTLLVAMLHEQRDSAEIEDQIRSNRAAIDAAMAKGGA